MSIRSSQPKDNCFVSVGDKVKIKSKDYFENGKTFIGIITCIDIRIQTNTDYDGLHTIIDLVDNPDALPFEREEYSLWLEDIESIEVLQFKE